ncbi:MAG: SdpI family protein [Candidatus Nanoarchaeia archaeon]|nr:SdpI family protein [Candidatus Nanoarchaeia archaeon]
MDKKNFILLSILMFSLMIFLILINYNNLNEKMITNWDFNGEPSGYSSKLEALIIMPITSIFIFIIIFISIFFLKKQNKLEDNENTIYNFMLIILLFLLSMQFFIIYKNLGYNIDTIKFIMSFFTILFYYSGVVLKDIKQNNFIGVRTIWTLKNEDVWNKTNQLGAYFFKFFAIVSFIGVIIPKFNMIFLMILIFLGVIYLYFYSFYLYKKTNNLNNINTKNINENSTKNEK